MDPRISACRDRVLAEVRLAAVGYVRGHELDTLPVEIAVDKLIQTVRDVDTKATTTEGIR